jgi:hypothetical protein
LAFVAALAFLAASVPLFLSHFRFFAYGEIVVLLTHGRRIAIAARTAWPTRAY